MATSLPTLVDVQKGNYPFPSRDRSEDEKDQPLYSLNYCEAIYSRYLNDKCAILYSARDNLDTIRLYGKGAQPSELYNNWYKERATDDSSSSTVTNRHNKTRQGWENISHRVISPLPRIKNVIKGYVDRIGQDVFVDAIDPLSNDRKLDIKWRMFTIAQNMEFLNDIHMKAGIPMQDVEYMPVSATELNLYEAMGGFKLNYARSMEKLIRHTEEISGVEKRLRDEWVDDAVDLGVIAARIIYDRRIKKYRYKYMNPKYLIMQFVEGDDYSRSEYAGYVESYTISELKQILPDKEEEFFRGLAYIHRGKYGNKGFNLEAQDWDNFSKHSNRMGAFNYDDFIVEVMEVEWVDYKAERHLYYVRENGHASIRKLGKDSEVKLTKGQKNRGAVDMSTKMRRLRGAKWIIGTDIVFDNGLVNMTDRPKDTEVMHSFRLFTLRDLPITEQLVPIADDMAIAWYRWQDDRANIMRAGQALDVGMLENLQLGGEDWSFEKIIKLYRDTRVLLHQQSLTGRYEGGNVTPLTPIESQLLNALQEFVSSWEAALKRIEDVTGINLVLLGATAPQGSQVTTTQMSVQSAALVLKPLINTIGLLKTDLAETTMRRLQLAFKARKDIAKGYESVVGKADVELMVQAEKDAVQYGLRFENRPSDEMKEVITAAATASLQARRDGKPGIDMSQFIWITQQLESGGNIKELAALLEYLNIKSEQQIQANKERDIQMQGQQLQNVEATKAKAKEAEDARGFQRDVLLEREKRETERVKARESRGEDTRNNAPNTPTSGQSPPQRNMTPQQGNMA